MNQYLPTIPSTHPCAPAVQSPQFSACSCREGRQVGRGRSYSLAFCTPQRPSLISSRGRSWQSRQTSELQGHCVCAPSPEEVPSSVALSHGAQAFHPCDFDLAPCSTMCGAKEAGKQAGSAPKCLAYFSVISVSPGCLCSPKPQSCFRPNT